MLKFEEPHDIMVTQLSQLWAYSL